MKCRRWRGDASPFMSKAKTRRARGASGALFCRYADKVRLLHENQMDLSVAEGLRLVIAFNKIKDSSDRRVLMELAERLAR